MQVPRALGFPKRVVQQALSDEVPDLAAGLAYRFLFALFPFAIFLAALSSFVAGWLGMDDPTGQIMGALRDNLPPDVAQQIAPQLEAVLGVKRPGLLSIGAILALWAATGGISSLMNAMNKAYDVGETRSFFVKTGTAMVLTILGCAGILVAFVTIVGGSVLTRQAVETLGIPAQAWDTVSLLRWPLMLGVVALAVAVLFRFGPNVAVSFRWTLVGGLLFAVCWVLATAAFGVYVANFGNYADTYGALGGVVILMLWFYLTGLLVLIAAEVTSLLAKDHEPRKVAAARAASGPHPANRQAPEPAAGPQPQPEELREPGPGSDRPRRREPEPRATLVAVSGPLSSAGHGPAPIIRIPRPEPAPGGRTTLERPSRLFALLVVGAGAVAGAIAGLLAEAEEDGGTDRA